MIINETHGTLNCTSKPEIMDMYNCGVYVHNRCYHIHARVFSRDMLHEVNNILWRSEDERGILLGIKVPYIERYRGTLSNHWRGRIFAREYARGLTWGRDGEDLSGWPYREAEKVRTVYFYGPYGKVARLLLDFLRPVLSSRWRPVAEAFGIHDCDVDVDQFGHECLHGYMMDVVNPANGGYGVGFEIRRSKLGKVRVREGRLELAALEDLRARINWRRSMGGHVPSEGYLVRVEYDSRYPRDERVHYAFTGLRGLAEVIRRYRDRAPTGQVARRLRDPGDGDEGGRNVRARLDKVRGRDDMADGVQSVSDVRDEARGGDDMDDGGAASLYVRARSEDGAAGGGGVGSSDEDVGDFMERDVGGTSASSSESGGSERQGVYNGVPVADFESDSSDSDSDSSDSSESSFGRPSDSSGGGFAGAAFDDELDEENSFYDEYESDNDPGEPLDEFRYHLSMAHNRR
jgi:hypothetical protein